jgi:Carboxypeptidase regulatory-like domain
MFTVSRHLSPASAKVWLSLLICALLLCGSQAVTVKAQSQALNAQIEGVVTDSTGGALPNATVKATNTDTGTERTVTTDGSGVYRIPLLPLGTYRVLAESNGFKKSIREALPCPPDRSPHSILNCNPAVSTKK